MAQQTIYPRTSPYYNTPVINNKFLDVLTYRPIPANPIDVLMTITPVYEYRPDLLAYDLYGDPSLWWVFAMRNPNALQDPIFSMRIGVQIFLPKKETLQGVLG